MPDITNAYAWAIQTCNAPNVGYSQAYRNQQIVGEIIYYDCSSFINYALLAGGFVTPGYAPNNNAFTTYTMNNVLQSLGFTRIPITDEWLPGDILNANPNVSNHTEMVYQGRITMGAHTNAVPLPDQVSINNGSSAVPGIWRDCWRWGNGASEQWQWIKGNRYLDASEMQNNAFIVYSTMYYRGWTLNAVCGMLGNMQSESSINPGIWQNLTPNPSLGWGLVQWTPSTNFTDWAAANGYENDDGDAQLKWIDEETVPVGQWIPTAAYPISFDEFKQSTNTPENLASAFLLNFERPEVPVEEQRRQQARAWYEYLKDMNPWIPPIVDNHTPKMPLYMYRGFQYFI